MNPILKAASGLEIINAAGFSTRVGGSCPDPAVLDAMLYAQKHYFEIDDLLRLASKVIAEATGSPAGIVTAGAGAALALGTAAVLARNDITIMDRLPDLRGVARTSFLYPVRNRFDYDHPVRMTGATLVEVDFAAESLEDTLARALSPAIAGVVFVWKSVEDESLIRRIAQLCQSHHLPFLLDAAMGLPPARNLRMFYGLGCNLVAISGGKHLNGPQNSGILFGDQDLIDSAWLQMVDMDVRPGSWSRRELIQSGYVPSPPRHGFGRAMKVGKDVILGCLTAISAYEGRDFDAEQERWREWCVRIVRETQIADGFRLEMHERNSTGQYPVVRLQADRAADMNRLRGALKRLPRKIILGEDEDDETVGNIYPLCLSDADVPEIIAALSRLTVDPL